LLISETIDDTKERFRGHGGIFIFWTPLIVIVFGSQLIFSLLKLYKFTMLPVALFPVGAIFTGLFVWKEYRKHNLPKTIIGMYCKILAG